MKKLVDELRGRSLFDIPLEVTEDDRILVLVTCSYKDPDGRLMVCCRALRSGEKGGEYAVVEDQWVPENVFAFTRSDRRETLMILTNFSGEYTECALPDAQRWQDLVTGELFDEELNCPVLSPWGWRILELK